MVSNTSPGDKEVMQTVDRIVEVLEEATIEVGRSSRVASNRHRRSCMLWGYQRSCGFTPVIELIGSPRIGHDGVNPMNGLSPHE